MECLNDEQLTSLLHEELALEVNDAWAGHLDQCVSCRQRLEELAGGTGWMPKWNGEPAARLDESSLDRYRTLTLATNGDTLFGPVEAGAGRLFGDDSLSAFLLPSERPEFQARFGPFYVTGIIGRGGMGIVFKAHDPSLKRDVAVKVLAPQLAANERARKRFLREARAAARVVDDHVVTIHTVDEIRGFPFLVMQYVEGESLEQHLQRTGYLPPSEAVRVAREIALGLRAAHAAGVVHRDIKPSNILLEAPTGRCKITDFGLARTTEDETITQPDHIAGTPQYMAPEQALGEPVDQRTDLYCLGALLYCVCCGHPPFDGKTPLSVLKKVSEGVPPSVRGANSAIPNWFESVIAHLMAKEPAQRFQSADELLEALAKGEPVPTSETPRPRGGRTLVVGLAIAVVLLLGWFGVRWQGTSIAGKANSPSVVPGVSERRESSSGVETSPCRVLHTDGTTDFARDLDRALELSRDGSTIELGNSEPIEVDHPLDTQGKALVIRAARGSIPVLVMTLDETSRRMASLTASGPLVLEGIELRCSKASPQSTILSALLHAEEHTILVSNCLFNILPASGSRLPCVSVVGSRAVFRNSYFVSGTMGTGILARIVNGTQIDVESCAFLAENALTLSDGKAGTSEPADRIRIGCSTVLGQSAVHLFGRERRPAPQDSPIVICAERCLFDVGFLCTATTGRGPDPIRAEAIALDLLGRGIQWTGTDNVYSVSRSYCGFALGVKSWAVALSGPRSLNSWQDFCHEEADSSQEAEVFFPDASCGARPKVGDLIDGPGFRFVLPRQLKGAAEVGAAIDSLGPGKAYAAWRDSPEYEEWRNLRKEVLGE